MNLTSILGFVSLAGWLMLIGGAALAISNAAQNRTARPGVALALVGLVIGAFFFIASSGLVLVGATEVAVVFQSIGGNAATNSLWANPLGPGVHIIVPIINEPVIYSTAIQNYTMAASPNEGQRTGDDSIDANTRDNQRIHVDVAVLYNINVTRANTVHIKWQNRYENDLIRPTVRSLVRQTMANYSVNDLYGGSGLTGAAIEGRISALPKIQLEIGAALKTVLEANGLELREFLLREITFSPEFIKAVEEKQVAEQQAERAKQDAERARTVAKGQADAAVTAAEGESKAVIAKATGEAEAIRLRAIAEARALELINEQLSKNPMLIQWQYVQKLAGNITLALVPSNTPFLFDINSLVNANKVPTPAPTGEATKP